MKRKIIFVYNASSSKLSKYLDTVHKIISPSTYSCDLCSLTYGSFSEKDLWRNFREKMQNYEFVFMYKNDFIDVYKHVDNLPVWYPVVLEENSVGFEDILLAEEFELINSLQELISVLEVRFMNSGSFVY